MILYKTKRLPFSIGSRGIISFNTARAQSVYGRFLFKQPWPGKSTHATEREETGLQGGDLHIASKKKGCFLVGVVTVSHLTRYGLRSTYTTKCISAFFRGMCL